MAINKGLALVSVADVLFFNPITDEFMGEGLALTDSTLTQEVQSIEQRGGYLNALLFDIKHSKNITVELQSATFKMEYLAFQTGTPIVTDLDSIYKFDECVSFKGGIGTTESAPLGNVYVRMPNGVVKTIKPSGSTINIGMPDFNGQLQVIYQYNSDVDKITIDTKTQPLLVKAVMRVHTLTQDGVEGFLQITIPRLKFNGSITLSLTADAVSGINIGGTAQEYVDDCGNAYYADAKFIETAEKTIPVEAIVASPNVLQLDATTNSTATANIIGVRSLPYSNVMMDNSKLTFQSSDATYITVDRNGLITCNRDIDVDHPVTVTVSYEGLQDIITITTSPL